MNDFLRKWKSFAKDLNKPPVITKSVKKAFKRMLSDPDHVGKKGATCFCTKGTNFNECGNGFAQYLRSGKKQMSPEYAEIVFTRPLYMFGTKPGNRGIPTWREYLDRKRKGELM